MNARFFNRALLAVTASLATIYIAGCKAQPDASASSQKPSRITAAAQPAPTTAPAADAQSADNSSVLPDTLAQKTSEYAKSLDPTATAPPSPRPIAPSTVHWGDPKPRRAEHPINAPAAANTATALATPSADSAAAPTAKSTSPPAVVQGSATDTVHIAAVTQSAKSNALNDVPAIVPEYTDFANSSASHAGPDSLEKKFSQHVRDNPRDVAGQLDYELYEMLKDESSPQLASISTLPNEDREVVAALVDGISNFRTSVRQDNNMLLSKKIRPLLDMADRLRTQAELSVPTVALCKRVDGYGKYEPIDPPRFPAGRDNPVIVYCEIENFESRMNDQRMWQTRLSQEVTLFTETGMFVWKDKSRPIVDECRDRRHDFFLYDLIKLPSNLTIGRYLLKVTIVDQTANRVAEQTVPVEFAAQ